MGFVRYEIYGKTLKQDWIDGQGTTLPKDTWVFTVLGVDDNGANITLWQFREYSRAILLAEAAARDDGVPVVDHVPERS